jgi:hypothetical protein
MVLSPQEKYTDPETPLGGKFSANFCGLKGVAWLMNVMSIRKKV